MRKYDISFYNGNQELIGRYYVKDVEEGIQCLRRDKISQMAMFYTKVDISNVKHEPLIEITQ